MTVTPPTETTARRLDPDPEPPVDAGGSPRRRWLRPLIGLVAGVGAVSVVVGSAGGLADATDVLGRMSPWWLTVAGLAVAARLSGYAVQIRRLSRPSGAVPALVAGALSLTVYGFGAVTPAAPAEGLALAAAGLRRRGRTPATAHLILGLSEWFAQRTFYAVTALNLVVVVAAGHLAALGSWPFLVAALVVLAALAATAAAARHSGAAGFVAVVLGALRLRRARPPAEARRAAGIEWHATAMEVVGSPLNRAHLAGVSAGAVLADAATLWAACRAAGVAPHLEIVVLAATVGTMASWVPLLPAGLGLVEAAIPAVLQHFGAPLDHALAAAVAYRALGTLAPALVGIAAAGILRRSPRPGVPRGVYT